jgi:hypothetical protein
MSSTVEFILRFIFYVGAVMINKDEHEGSEKSRKMQEKVHQKIPATVRKLTKQAMYRFSGSFYVFLFLLHFDMIIARRGHWASEKLLEMRNAVLNTHCVLEMHIIFSKLPKDKNCQLPRAFEAMTTIL